MGRWCVTSNRPPSGPFGFCEDAGNERNLEISVSGRDTFVRCAKDQVGKRYVWATAGPETFDCSGLSSYCAQEAGLTITRSSYDQIHLGQAVPTQNLAPGDLLFWDTEHNGTAGHVGIYVGEGNVVNALNENRGVIVSKYDANYGGPYLGARRIFAAPQTPAETPPDPKAPHPTRNKDPIEQYPRRNRHERRRARKLVRRKDHPIP